MNYKGLVIWCDSNKIALAKGLAYELSKLSIERLEELHEDLIPYIAEEKLLNEHVGSIAQVVSSMIDIILREQWQPP